MSGKPLFFDGIIYITKTSKMKKYTPEEILLLLRQEIINDPRKFKMKYWSNALENCKCFGGILEEMFGPTYKEHIDGISFDLFSVSTWPSKIKKKYNINHNYDFDLLEPGKRVEIGVKVIDFEIKKLKMQDKVKIAKKLQDETGKQISNFKKLINELNLFIPSSVPDRLKIRAALNTLETQATKELTDSIKFFDKGICRKQLKEIQDLKIELDFLDMIGLPYAVFDALLDNKIDTLYYGPIFSALETQLLLQRDAAEANKNSLLVKRINKFYNQLKKFRLKFIWNMPREKPNHKVIFEGSESTEVNAYGFTTAAILASAERIKKGESFAIVEIINLKENKSMKGSLSFS